MECAICSRLHDSQRLPFLCPIDARNKLYPNRLQNLNLVLESESLRADIDSDHDAGYIADSLATRRRLAGDRTDEILAAAVRLRSEISAARDEIKARSLALARRRSDLASVREGLRDRRARQLRDVDAATQALRLRWKESAKDMACTRAFLCNEAVRLYGFPLGPDVISTSLAHIAHVLMLISHYLAIRLPAEITLPHRDYPQPTIFNLAGSYQHSPSSPSSRSNGTMTPSFLQPPEADSHHVPRPRPLFVDKPLPQLSEEDPATYSFFLEGVTLLAYDIAWLCCSQGVSVGDKGSFEDLCHMGRNLYSFVFEAQRQGYCQAVKPVDTANDPSPDEAAELQTDWIGRYSHGTTYHFLGSAHGTDFTRSFKLPSPIKLADKLKRKLLGDAPADWEVLDDEAWRVVDEGGKTETGGGVNGVKTGAVDRDAVKGSQKTEMNGWTKVKHRVGT
ncbi:hypothetical protein CDD80_6070 [Ophiocordyceps camponoti-rufipedis]|uniref:Autophagy-related protein 14 n=1 Tax=Ophiocordyceps camponoti-rufipedis TaxID=2004952 RepID=A0A2C5YLF4_9HYPO|nr:hypothetical protein CDD80_6070 [Ophiocordyceps camponoti-rufipedis]